MTDPRFTATLTTITEDISKYLLSNTHTIQNTVCDSVILSKLVPGMRCSLLTVRNLLVITHYLLLKFQSANQEAENILYDQQHPTNND